MHKIQLLLPLLLVVCRTTSAQDAMSLSTDLRRLSSNVRVERIQSSETLTRVRTEVFAQLMAVLENKWDNSWQSKTHLAIQQLGLWRSSKSVSMLLEHIDWELSKDTFPQGKKYPTWVSYPCAVALKEIGGREVREAILEKAIKDNSPKVQKLMAWVLHGAEGSDGALVIIDSDLSSAKAGQRRERLLALRDFVHKGEAVLADL